MSNPKAGWRPLQGVGARGKLGVPYQCGQGALTPVSPLLPPPSLPSFSQPSLHLKEAPSLSLNYEFSAGSACSRIRSYVIYVCILGTLSSESGSATIGVVGREASPICLLSFSSFASMRKGMSAIFGEWISHVSSPSGRHAGQSQVCGPGSLLQFLTFLRCSDASFRVL